MLQLVLFCHIYTPMLLLYAHTELGQCELYLQCYGHICSVIYDNNMKGSLLSVYSIAGHMVDASDFIYSTYLYIHHLICMRNIC